MIPDVKLLGNAMPTWILAVIVASIAITGALTWVLYKINPTQARGRPRRSEGGEGDGGEGAG